MHSLKMEAKIIRVAFLVASVFYAQQMYADVIFSFKKIADTNTLMPDGDNDTFGMPLCGGFVEPAIDNGIVIFEGMQSTSSNNCNPSKEGIYKYENGKLSVIADRTTVIPSGSLPDETFRNFLDFSFENGLIAIQAHGSSGDPSDGGIYSKNLGETGLNMVVNGNTSLPDSGAGRMGYDWPVVDGTDILFAGAINGTPVQDGIFRVSTGSITTVVDINTPIPDQPGNTFSRFIAGSGMNLSADNGDIVWRVSNDPNTDGSLYTTVGGMQLLVDEDVTLMPGTSTVFTNIWSPLLENGNVFFYGQGAGGGLFGLYQHDGSSLSVIFDQSVPGRDFGSIENVAKDGNLIAFKALNVSTSSGGTGLYVFLNNTLHKVIDVAHILDGKTIFKLNLRREGVSGNQIAFQSDFSGSADSIYVATLHQTENSGAILPSGSNLSIDLMGGGSTSGGISIQALQQPVSAQIDVEHLIVESGSTFLPNTYEFTEFNFTQSDVTIPFWQITSSVAVNMPEITFGYNESWFSEVERNYLVIFQYVNGEWVLPDQSHDIENRSIKVASSDVGVFAIGISAQNVPYPLYFYIFLGATLLSGVLNVNSFKSNSDV